MTIDGTLVLMVFTSLAGFTLGMRCERERCAEIVEEYNKCLPDVIRQIAKKIRSGK